MTQIINTKGFALVSIPSGKKLGGALPGNTGTRDNPSPAALERGNAFVQEAVVTGRYIAPEFYVLAWYALGKRLPRGARQVGAYYLSVDQAFIFSDEVSDDRMREAVQVLWDNHIIVGATDNGTVKLVTSNECAGLLA
jgi:hypothetical protein